MVSQRGESAWWLAEGGGEAARDAGGAPAVRAVQHEILQLQVPMADVVPMAKFDRIQQLPENSLGLPLIDLALRLEQLLHGPSVNVLEHEVDGARCLDHL